MRSLRRHRQLDALARIALAPAKILKKAEIFGELDAKPLRFHEVFVALQGIEEIAYGAKVIADQFVQPLALVAGNGDRGGGHGAPPLGRAPKPVPMPPR